MIDRFVSRHLVTQCTGILPIPPHTHGNSEPRWPCRAQTRFAIGAVRCIAHFGLRPKHVTAQLDMVDADQIRNVG